MELVYDILQGNQMSTQRSKKRACCLALGISISLPVIDGESALETRTAMMTRPISQRPEKLLSSQPRRTCCPIVELRQYTLHPGKRDVLIDLFDREFVETQETAGISVIGQFRDLDNPDRFVWLRGFPDMPSRAHSLTEFYTGPAWKAHREAANATMIDSGNVLLLRPALPTSSFPFKSSDRGQPGTKDSNGLIIGTIYYFNGPVTGDFVEFFERTLKPVVSETGASVLAYFVSEPSANNFPRLPVREGEYVFVWFGRFADQASYERHVAALSQSKRWRSQVAAELERRLKQAPEVLRLSPTTRSQLRS